MFDQRHCTKKDLNLLIKETDKIKKCLVDKNSKNEGKNAELQSFLARFDSNLADKTKEEIEAANGDYQRIERAIVDNVEILKQYIEVDIFEHE